MKDSSRPLKLFAYTYLVFLYAPVLLLPVFAFNNSTTIAFPLQGFTLNWFITLAEQTSLHTVSYTHLTLPTILLV